MLNDRVLSFFPVTRGVRQGCPLSPALFVLSLYPLLRGVASHPHIRGFPMIGQETVAVPAYADDISVFVHDAQSFRAFLAIFDAYSTGALLNATKRHALRFGSFNETLPVPIPFVDAGRVLGVPFEQGGASPRSWGEGIARTSDTISVAAAFDLSIGAKVAVKSRAFAFAFYVVRIVVMPRRTAGRLASLAGALIWDGGTALVARHLLQLPTNRGGLGLPCVATAARAPSAKLADALVADTSYPGSSLLPYWLSTARPAFALGQHSGPQAVSPLPFYRAAAGCKLTVDADLRDVNFSDASAARIRELVASARLSL